MGMMLEITKDELVNLNHNFKAEFLVGEESGQGIGRKALFSPTGEFLDVVDGDFILVPPRDIVKEVEKSLVELKVPVKESSAVVSDNFSRYGVSWRTDISDEIVPKDTIDFGLNLWGDIKSGKVGMEIMSWRQVCTNGLVAFQPVISMRKKASDVLSPDKIGESIRFCMDQWKQVSVNKYKEMVDSNISKEEALVRVSELEVGKRDKNSSIEVVETKFEELGTKEVTMWEYFNMLMFAATYLVARERRRAFNHKIEADFNPSRICYHGVPHRVISK